MRGRRQQSRRWYIIIDRVSAIFGGGHKPSKKVILIVDHTLREPTMAASRNTILRLINAAQHSACPCHSTASAHAHGQIQALSQMHRYAAPVNAVQKEYAFEARLFVVEVVYVFLSRTYTARLQRRT